MTPASSPPPGHRRLGETNEEGRLLVVQEPAFMVTKQSKRAATLRDHLDAPVSRIAWQPTRFKAQPPTERSQSWCGLTPTSGFALVASNSFGHTTAAGNR